jgi:hypothetical protein
LPNCPQIADYTIKSMRIENRGLKMAGKRRRSAQRSAWTKAQDALLGTMSDQRLARRLGRSPAAVKGRRNLKRISLRRKWKSADDKLLGAKPDNDIARLTGFKTSSVAERRRKLGIPSLEARQQSIMAAKLAAMSNGKIARLLRQSHRLVPRRTVTVAKSAVRWTAAEDRLVGKWPDERLARFLGRTIKSVGARRLALGIRFAPSYPRWTAEEERLLDPALAEPPVKKWDALLARRLGRTIVAVRSHRRQKYGRQGPPVRKWEQRERRLLGTRPDREVAALIGRTCETVQTTRWALGIPSYRARTKFRWGPAKDRLLGTQSDSVLAKRFDCSISVVKMRRRVLGIRGCFFCPWTRREERLVGTMPDVDVARIIGRSLKAVRHRRLAIGLPQPKAGPG